MKLPTKSPGRKARVRKHAKGYLATTEQGNSGYGISITHSLHDAHTKEMAELNDAMKKFAIEQQKKKPTND